MLFVRFPALAVERPLVVELVLHQRLEDFARVLRHPSVSAQAFVKECPQAPVALPTAQGGGPVLLPSISPAVVPSSWELFTRRALPVVREMVAGRSNRDIAASLQLSLETAKTYVSRVIRKRGAVNRADAAAGYVRLTTREMR